MSKIKNDGLDQYDKVRSLNAVDDETVKMYNEPVTEPLLTGVSNVFALWSN